MLRRWSKLEKDFKTKNGRYDISKIPDIYDCIKYDVQHNGSLKLENTMELYRLSKALADIVIPQVSIAQYLLLLPSIHISEKYFLFSVFKKPWIARNLQSTFHLLVKLNIASKE